jgi:hypothetical protein
LCGQSDNFKSGAAPRHAPAAAGFTSALMMCSAPPPTVMGRGGDKGVEFWWIRDGARHVRVQDISDRLPPGYEFLAFISCSGLFGRVAYFPI